MKTMEKLGKPMKNHEDLGKTKTQKTSEELGKHMKTGKTWEKLGKPMKQCENLGKPWRSHRITCEDKSDEFHQETDLCYELYPHKDNRWKWAYVNPINKWD